MRKLGLVPPAEVSDAPRLRVAIASSNGKALDAHFGSAKKFVVYDVSAADSQLVEIIDFSDTSDESGDHGAAAEDRIGSKIGTLKGCQVLLVLAIGGPVAAKVVKAGVHPIKVATAESISSAIEHVQTLMSGSPPPWLRKLLAPKTERSLRFMDLEDES
jgi:nitrogen fixation protein NifX